MVKNISESLELQESNHNALREPLTQLLETLNECFLRVKKDRGNALKESTLESKLNSTEL